MQSGLDFATYFQLFFNNRVNVSYKILLFLQKYSLIDVDAKYYYILKLVQNDFGRLLLSQAEFTMFKMTTFAAIQQKSIQHAKCIRIPLTDLYQEMANLQICQAYGWERLT